MARRRLPRSGSKTYMIPAPRPIPLMKDKVELPLLTFSLISADWCSRAVCRRFAFITNLQGKFDAALLRGVALRREWAGVAAATGRQRDEAGQARATELPPHPCPAAKPASWWWSTARTTRSIQCGAAASYR